MPAVEYRETDIRDIELIRPLWTQLNEHHRVRARVFRSHYEQWTFDDRKVYFEKIAGAGILQVELAFDRESARYVGYCISSVSADHSGEIESVFVEEEYRSQGIGSTLVHRALSWLGAKGSIRNRVSVGDGNEEAFGFYQKFGFYPRMTVLEQRVEYHPDTSAPDARPVSSR